MSDWREGFSNTINSYVFDCILPSSKEVVKFKAIDTQTLKKLLVYEKSNNIIMLEKMLDELILSSVIDKIDVENMLYYDRLFLLISIRAKSKGESITQQYDCPVCSGQSMQKMSFEDMPLIEYKEPSEKTIEVVPGIILELKHITRKDQQIAYSKIFNDKDILDDDKEMYASFYMIASAICGYDNGKDKVQIENLDDKLFIFEKLPSTALDKIKDWLEQNKFGLEFEFTKKCRHCGYEEKQKVEASGVF